MKVLFAIAAALISSAAGFAMSERLKRREEQLRLLVLMLEEMSAMLRYRAVPTDEMIRTLICQPGLKRSEFLAQLARRPEGEAPFREAWKSAAENAAFLSEDDRVILYHLGERLGTTDVDGQLSLIGVSRGFAERNLLEAGEEYRSKGGVFRKTGLLCGAALGILIL